MKTKKENSRGPGRPPGPVTRTYTVGEYQVTVVGPKAGLKFESRHNYLQFAADDGELREQATVREIWRDDSGAWKREQSAENHEAPIARVGMAVPGGFANDPTIGLTGPTAEELAAHRATIAADPVRSHLQAVTDSIPGAY